MFDFIHSVISNEISMLDDQKTFIDLVFDNYDRLIRIDSAKSSNLFFTYFNGDLSFYQRIIDNLKDSFESLFEFIRIFWSHSKQSPTTKRRFHGFKGNFALYS